MSSQSLNIANRSSTIFPLYLGEKIIPKLSFLNYWNLKNSSKVKDCIFTLRDIRGEVLERKQYDLNPLGSHEVNLKKMFTILGSRKGLSCSLEVEIFFKEKPLFNYPAIFLMYSNNQSANFVHSCIRTYDQSEQPEKDSRLAQSGFDIFVDQVSDTKLIFINGLTGKDKPLKIEFTSFKGESFSFETLYKNSNSKELNIVSLSKILKEELKAPNGHYTAKVFHEMNDVFPRFYILRDFHNQEALPCLTHSFFDHSISSFSPEDNELYNNIKNSDQTYDSAFSIPVLTNEEFETEIISYASNASNDSSSAVSFYSPNGDFLFNYDTDEELRDITSSLKVLKLSEKLIEHREKIRPYSFLNCHFRFYKKKTSVPWRLKFGLNIYRKGHEEQSSNACFSAFSMIDGVKKKNFTRRWGSIGGRENLHFIVGNTQLWDSDADYCNKLEATFYNSRGESLTRLFDLPQNALLDFSKQYDDELSDFLGSDLGQVMVSLDKPFFDGWNISIGETHVGVDHAF